MRALFSFRFPARGFVPASILTLLAALALVLVPAAPAAAAAPSSAGPVSPASVPPALPDATGYVSGVELAKGITEITGVAISPLLGVSAVGAWRYYHTPDSHRDRLPWFCRPWVWGTGLGLIVLCFLKDFLGTVSPPLLKKPLDVLELFENKASAVVASAAFVPVVAASLGSTAPELAAAGALPGASEALALTAAAGLPEAGWGMALLLVPAAVAAFLTVWLAGHAINVLILLCPFGFIDALLKLLKTGLLVTLVGAYALNPWLGAGFCLLLILVAALIAPWTFRLTVFGTFCATDLLLRSRGKRGACPERPHAFLACRIGGTPVRTYGRLSCGADGTLQFSYRSWIVGPRRTVVLPRSGATLTQGLIFPSLLLSSDGTSPLRQTVIFLPRYRTLEPALAGCLQIAEIRPGGVLRGLAAVRGWFSETVRGIRPA